ncbi:TetR family transcriptional regulator [Saccharopolyspora erythraea NRRL 2338]|uniref:Transcriptional regulator, TetR family n=2 Tax=Saccharopolyspora erythraea TaxID=1836 RepID=A4F8M5_SACEN|nr:TetR/AcrR family transcriptional regulator [Saccharopolyspora erythraea]EQD85998.1 TetR family transcriptional regulator [Saccharopolyspora erythraea D]PFG94194.1 TetR family transcriptional regulator [Saccharopolyspora erythraea NRRL 2338]QRK90973.1 TetR/AcrR family transcriptional regulator [Saccharopolyspora erythraea]CAM00400.1 transcriptional regulator, TetR family [Saccharopolyspora erythraea NRRL 2338]
MTETAQPTRGVRLPRDARRAQLLDAAQHVFVHNGYHAAAMDDIAERAGVSKPVLYQHFPGKLELYLALLETHGGELVRRVRQAIESTPDNKHRVRAAVAALYEFVDTEGQAFRLVFESDLRSEPSVEQAVQNALSGCIDAVAEAVTADAGLDHERARLLAVGLVGLSQVTARYWLDASQTVSRDEAVTLMSTLAWKGISGFPLQAG